MIDYAVDFRERLWSWYVAAITELSARDDFREVSVRSNWEQNGAEYFHRYPTVEFGWSVHALIRSLELEEWAAVEASAEADERLRGKIGSIVSVANVARTIRPIDIAQAVLWPTKAGISRADLDTEETRNTFLNRAQAILDFFEATNYVFEVTTPIQRLGASGNFRLTEELELVQITPDQTRELLNAGAIGAQVMGQDSYFANLGPQVCVVQRVQRRVEPALRADSESELVSRLSLDRDRFMTCLALSSTCRATPLISRSIARGPVSLFFFGSISPSQPSVLNFEPPLVLDHVLWGKIEECWEALSRSRASNTVDLAIRRFRQATVRGDLHDRLLDLMIAAEAIFLENVEGELSFQLSLRAASWLGSDSKERRSIFELFRRAYAVRSIIAHGADPARIERVLRGMPVSEFIALVEDSMRAAIRKVVIENQCAAPTADYWQTAIFGAES